ncbi:MAG: MurT ligase domain-containing protein [Breznakia sp.]
MQVRLIICLVRSLRFFLQLLGRGGSLPGNIALKMDRNILKKLMYDATIILVSGTNGKTSTANMMYEVMKTKYQRVLCNQRGDNLLEGIATLILSNTSMKLHVQADCIVMEVDELNVERVMQQIPVNHVVINNFFRDQLDRAGEMERVVSRVESSLKGYTAHLYLNANDPSVVRLALVNDKAQVHYFSVAKTKESTKQSREASEGRFCPQCHHELVYDYYHYSHIGKFHCPACAFGHNEMYIQATNVNISEHCFEVQGFRFSLIQDALYAVYNSIAVLSVAQNLHIQNTSVNEVFNRFELNDGRMEIFDIGRACLLNLIKNPTGANEVMKYIMRDQGDKDIVIVLNDNIQDGRDVSWIWDAHFELLLDNNTKNIICVGTRAYDMALRIKYGDYQGNIEVIEDMDKAIKQLKLYAHHAYVMATYTALQTMRTVLRRNA